MKSLGVYLLYAYKSPLHGQTYTCLVYGTLMLLNSWMIVTIGNNPGYAPRVDEEEQSFASAMNYPLCEICMCPKKMRMKHCYRCAKCVYKYDHHCPWIGACVGEYNQGDFWLFLLTQSLQSIWSLDMVKKCLCSSSKPDGSTTIPTVTLILVNMAL